MPNEVQNQVVTAFVGEASIICKDAEEREVAIGGKGPRATDLLLMAVAGCSGATLKALLKRDGFEPKDFEMKVEGERSQDRPRRFKDIYVSYRLSCKGLTYEKLDEYLEITERACPVIQSVKSSVHLKADLIDE